MGHEPVLIPDYTLFIQLGIFFASYFVLRFLVFKPYLELLRVRRERTSGLKAHALQAREEAEKLKTTYEEFMRSERKRANAWADGERKKVLDEERDIVSTARDQAAQELQVIRANISSGREKARKQLLPLISEYSSQLVSKLIGRKVSLNGTHIESARLGEFEPRVPTP